MIKLIKVIKKTKLIFLHLQSKKQQYKMAKYCDEILGELLLKEPLPNYPVSWLIILLA